MSKYITVGSGNNLMMNTKFDGSTPKFNQLFYGLSFNKMSLKFFENIDILWTNKQT